jgi:hypothetical protein
LSEIHLTLATQYFLLETIETAQGQLKGIPDISGEKLIEVLDTTSVVTSFGAAVTCMVPILPYVLTGVSLGAWTAARMTEAAKEAEEAGFSFAAISE